jgi:magnesium chelatase family protein
MDRIDMHIEVTPVPFEELNLRRSGPKSEAIRDRIIDCRRVQAERFKDSPGIYCNAQMTTRQVKETCRLDTSGQALMKAAMQRIGLSARAYHRILKVARTISDLAGEEGVSTTAEAIQYRTLDRASWRR